jgi:hypothetical protein
VLAAVQHPVRNRTVKIIAPKFRVPIRRQHLKDSLRQRQSSVLLPRSNANVRTHDTGPTTVMSPNWRQGDQLAVQCLQGTGMQNLHMCKVALATHLKALEYADV